MMGSLSIEEVESMIGSLKADIEALEKLRLELLLENGKAYRCRECGVIVEIDKAVKNSEHYKEGLCYSCWRKKRLEELRNKWREFFKGVEIIDVDPGGNPYYDIGVSGIMIRKGKDVYELLPECDDDLEECTIQVIDYHNRRIISIDRC